MHKLRFFAIVAASVTWAVSAPAHALLLGTSVTGSISFGNNPTNFFDPSNGFVPPGFGNSSPGTNTVTIVEPLVEFGFEDGANRDTANFTDNTLTIGDFVKTGAGSWTMTFSDGAFSGLSLVETSDNFVNGGVNCSLSSITVTCRWAGAGGALGQLTAAYSFISPTATVPEPGSLALLGLAFGALGLSRRRKNK